MKQVSKHVIGLAMLAAALVWAGLEWAASEDEQAQEQQGGYALSANEEVVPDNPAPALQTAVPAERHQAQGAQTQPLQAQNRPGQPSQAAPAPLDTRRMQAVQVLDPVISNPPMVVASLQIPEGWSPVGGVTWNEKTPCGGNQIQMNWMAIAPDSLTMVAMLPGFSWQVTGTQQQFNPCPVAPLRSTREFLEATARNLHPDAQVLGYEEVQPGPPPANQPPPAPGAQVRREAGRLHIAYNDNGIAMQEILGTTVTFSSMQGSVMGGTASVDALRAPAGRLDAQLLKRIGATAQLNPQWTEASSRRVLASINRHHAGVTTKINDWHQREMAIINARGIAERHAIRMRTNQEVAGIYNSIAANTSATNDRIHQRSREAIGEYNTYNGVGGSTVQNSIHNGQRVFQDANNPNNAYSTDQPYAQPPGGYVELERRR